MGNFHWPRCFHYVVKFVIFSVMTLLLSHFILFFLIFCVCKVSLFSLNNSIQSIVLVFCCKKVLLDLFNFLLQICNNIVMDNDKYPRKNSKCNKKLDFLNTFFGTAYKNFYCWCSILVVSAVSISVSVLA